MTILAHFGSKMAKKQDLHQDFKRSKEVVCMEHDLHQMTAKWRHLTASRLVTNKKTAAKNDHFGPFWF